MADSVAKSQNVSLLESGKTPKSEYISKYRYYGFYIWKPILVLMFLVSLCRAILPNFSLFNDRSLSESGWGELWLASTHFFISKCSASKPVRYANSKCKWHYHLKRRFVSIAGFSAWIGGTPGVYIATPWNLPLLPLRASRQYWNAKFVFAVFLTACMCDPVSLFWHHNFLQI